MNLNWGYLNYWNNRIHLMSKCYWHFKDIFVYCILKPKQNNLGNKIGDWEIEQIVFFMIYCTIKILKMLNFYFKNLIKLKFHKKTKNNPYIKCSETLFQNNSIILIKL